ncbi:MAG: NAD(P)H-hydrate dehydratase [Ruminococcus sp.]|jgi:NAD(P)H-hydrate epimerase|nr:NAD(P)H-hydrate dehydratase [Ruminococcus sp.]
MIPQKRDTNAYKNQFGRVVNFAGCFNMSGAAQLSTAAVLRSGAGLTILASTRDVINRIGGFLPEAMFFPLAADENDAFSGADCGKAVDFIKNADVVMFGCGVSQSAGAALLLEAILKSDVPVKIIDADGINLLARRIELLKEAKGTTVLTPHQGELERLCGHKITDSASREASAADFARENGVIVLSKGVPNFVCAKSVSRVFAGNPGLAKGGSGDVLAGIAAAFCAKEQDLVRALEAAVSVHGKAADLARDSFGETGMTAGDVVSFIPEAVMRICCRE